MADTKHVDGNIDGFIYLQRRNDVHGGFYTDEETVVQRQLGLGGILVGVNRNQAPQLVGDPVIAADRLDDGTNAWPGETQRVYVVPAGDSASALFPVLANSDGWYDITVRASHDSLFLRRLTGRVELPLPVSRLVASSSGTNLLLTWPGYVTNTLEFTATLSPAGAPVNASPSVVDSNAVLSVPMTNQAMFFRLRP